MNNKNVICLPTSGTYDIVLTTRVTAHPAVAPYPKGPFDYLVPINAGGAVELIYPIHRQILCKPEGLNNLECELSPSEYDALLEYHKSRSRGFGYGKKDTDYLFYLLGDPLPIKQPFFIKSIRVSAKKALEDFPIIRSKEAVTSAPKHETLAQEAQRNFSEAVANDAAISNSIKKIEEELERTGLEGEERRALTKFRVNQGVFRDNLLQKYGRCCLCRIKSPELLRASHIKPWAVSQPSEKLDTENGLLLCPNHDAAFDGGFISFDESGNILISERLAELDRVLLNIRPNMKIQLSERAKAYMDYHRKKILK